MKERLNYAIVSSDALNPLTFKTNHHASKEDPQYEIKSDKTEHIAVHKTSALSKNKKS